MPALFPRARRLWFWLSMVWLGLSPAGRAQGLVISEFMAANGNVLHDVDGEASDWVEIYNPTQQTAALAGWHLTDDAQAPAKWRFPDVTVPANGFLIVFASGKDRRDPARELHANFSLS